MANAPLGEIDEELASLNGRVLSVGCGFGVVERYLVRRNHQVEVIGFDLAEDRVRAASATQSAAGPVVVRHADVTALGDIGRFNSALVMDVLHHLEPSGQTVLFKALARLVEPGGSVIVKDIAKTPRWKHAFNAAHDRLVVGDTTYCRDPDQMAEAAVDSGLQTDGWRRVARLSPYPHYVIRATVPKAP